MCGRFTLKTPVANWLKDLFPNWNAGHADLSLSADLTRARYNIAPTQQIVVVRNESDGTPIIEGMRWGLLPVWADSLSGGYNMINSRSESIADKPSFRPSLINKRCVILADGYYEWKKLTPKIKEPYWIHTAGERVFAMAGLWAENRKIHNPESILSATIITTPSNADLTNVHDRMPALMVNSMQISAWLAPALNGVANIDRLLSQLQPSPSGAVQVRRVSTLVNRAANDCEDVLDPI